MNELYLHTEFASAKEASDGEIRERAGWSTRKQRNKKAGKE